MYTTAVSLGRPVTAPCLIPVCHSSTPICIDDPFMVDGNCYRVTAISLGSPHGAVPVDSLAYTDVDAAGRALGTHELFPEGASIVFFEMTGESSLDARLWQRGGGGQPFTREAAAVAAIAAIMLHKTLLREVSVTMGGKTLLVSWDAPSGEVFLFE